MTHYIISNIIAGRYFVKAVTMEKPCPDAFRPNGDFTLKQHNTYLEAERSYYTHYRQAPEYLVEGSVTGKIGDEIEGSLQKDYLKIVFVPRSASTEFNKEDMAKVQADIDSVNAGAIIDKSKLLHQKDDPDLRQLLSDVQAILAGYSQDDTWSDWDESVRKRVVDMQYKLEPSASTVEPDKIYIDVGRARTVTVQNGKLDALVTDNGRSQWMPITVLPPGEWVIVERRDNVVTLAKAIKNESGVEPESKGEEILDDLFDFNNKLARFQDRIPSEIKVQWNDLLSKYAKRKASLQQPTYSREQIELIINEVLNFLGYGFVGREKLIENAFTKFLNK